MLTHYNKNMEIDYIKDPNCECSKYPDFGNPATALNMHRKPTAYVMFGYIHDEDICRECACHKKYRLQKRYKIISAKSGLPDIEKLKEKEYLGDPKNFNKLMLIPTITETHPEYANTIYWVKGDRCTQKTTSCAKLMLEIYERGKFPNYILFNDIIQKISNTTEADYNTHLKDVREADYLFVDDSFVADVVNFKAPYNLFLTEVLKRKMPTIFITKKSFEELKENSHYDKSLIEEIESRVNYRHSQLDFNDNVENLMLKKNGPIDLWSL